MDLDITDVTEVNSVEALVESIAYERARCGKLREFGDIRDFAYRMGLQTVAPQQVIVGGTNGKGTTTHILQQMLTQQGLRVGTTTSPHMHDYRERIALDGQPIEDEEAHSAVRAIDRESEDIVLSYFDITTLAALYAFKRWKVDVAILEVGLGGRIDCTNVTDCEVAVITNVDLDHREILGNTIEAISQEKVAIARSGKTLVYADERDNPVINDYASRIGCQLQRYNRTFGCLPGSHVFARSQRKWRVYPVPKDVVPRSQVFSTALQVATVLGHTPHENEIARYRFTQLPGRLELFEVQGRKWFLDVAHNPSAVAQLRESLFGEINETCVTVFATSADKDVRGMLENLIALPSDRKRTVHTLILTDSMGRRPMSANDAVAQAGEFDVPIYVESDFDDAISRATEIANADTPILVLGSFDIVARTREYLRRRLKNSTK